MAAIAPNCTGLQSFAVIFDACSIPLVGWDENCFARGEEQI
jgi:hypothetical protein